MLPKRRRLTAAEVREVIRKGRSQKANFMSFTYMASSSPMRVAVVVPKSVAKKATMRNRVRRAVYQALTGLPGTGTGVVLVRRIPSAPLSAALSNELAILIKTHQ